MDDLAVLQTIRIKGTVGRDVLIALLAVDGDPATAIEDLLDAGAIERGERGLQLTARGQEALKAALSAERASVDQTALERLYDEFCSHNDTFKRVATDWQLRPLGSQSVANDHTDFAYDERVLRRLRSVHRNMMLLMPRLEAEVPRFGSYSRRFEFAHEQLLERADNRYFTSPVVDSYHTVWFELHEELIVTIGLTRGDEAAAGRA